MGAESLLEAHPGRKEETVIPTKWLLNCGGSCNGDGGEEEMAAIGMFKELLRSLRRWRIGYISIRSLGKGMLH